MTLITVLFITGVLIKYILMIENNFKLCNYDEFQEIKDADILPLMQIIWKSFNFLHKDVLKKVKELFPQYDVNILS